MCCSARTAEWSASYYLPAVHTRQKFTKLHLCNLQKGNINYAYAQGIYLYTRMCKKLSTVPAVGWRPWCHQDSGTDLVILTLSFPTFNVNNIH